jgi:hypothetical protein
MLALPISQNIRKHINERAVTFGSLSEGAFLNSSLRYAGPYNLRHAFLRMIEQLLPQAFWYHNPKRSPKLVCREKRSSSYGVSLKTINYLLFSLLGIDKRKKLCYNTLVSYNRIKSGVLSYDG